MPIQRINNRNNIIFCNVDTAHKLIVQRVKYKITVCVKYLQGTRGHEVIVKANNVNE